MDQPSNVQFGVLCSFGAMMLFCVGDAFAKHYMQFFTVFQIVAITFTGAMVLSGIHAWLTKLNLKAVHSRTTVIVYGALFLMEMLAFFLALRHMNFSVVFIFVMAIPIVASQLAQLLLNEPLSLRRKIALVLAFAGVLCTVLMRHDGVNLLEITVWGVFFSLMNIAFGASKVVYLRKYGGHEDPKILNFWSLVLIAVATLALACYEGEPLVWRSEAAWLMIVPLLCFFGEWLYLLSYRHAPTTMIAPVMYSQLIAAIAIGVLFFGETLTWPQIAGSVMVMLAGLAFYWPDSKKFKIAVADKAG